MTLCERLQIAFMIISVMVAWAAIWIVTSMIQEIRKGKKK